MIKISRLADYAVVVLSTLAGKNGELMTASWISENTKLPEPTVAKVLKILAKAGLVASVRGANGGYKLSKTPARIRVADIIEAIEGPISLTACVEGSHEICDYRNHCPVKGRWDDVNIAIRIALESIALSDMMPGHSFLKLKQGKELYGRI